VRARVCTFAVFVLFSLALVMLGFPIILGGGKLWFLIYFLNVLLVKLSLIYMFLFG
jgi:hypothetical protein